MISSGVSTVTVLPPFDTPGVRTSRTKSEGLYALPFVGVVTTWNEAAPCNTTLMRQANAAAVGVKQGGGTPREFCTITVTDGIAMGHEGMKSSLVSREVIADSVELTMRGHCYDALVGIAGARSAGVAGPGEQRAGLVDHGDGRAGVTRRLSGSAPGEERNEQGNHRQP